MKKLKWKYERGTSGSVWCSECETTDGKILFMVVGSPYGYVLFRETYRISRFKRVASAKMVAQLIHQG